MVSAMSPFAVVRFLIDVLRLLTSFFVNGMLRMVPYKSDRTDMILLVGMLLLCRNSISS
uniref:Uncharacterized protein n=1 Tax=Oryza sativa subsp. japonica TaxID=39947 RepID=Q6Z3C4_ORYSJ|nr:unknown protein [Oryza sativa Japonica Group]